MRLTRKDRRRGIVLVVVLALLTLLELVGLTFVLVASSQGSIPAVERALNEIQVAQSVLGGLIENPDDPARRKVAVISVGRALEASSDAAADLDADRRPEAQRLPGLLEAGSSLFRVLRRLLQVPDC